MEKLIVENFLSIERAELEIGRFTVIIGPQASGKSVLAKLVYFFRDFLSFGILESLEEGLDKSGLSKSLISGFERFFQRSSWSRQAVDIRYQAGSVQINLRHLPGKTRGGAVQISYSDELRRFYRIFSKEYGATVVGKPAMSTFTGGYYEHLFSMTEGDGFQAAPQMDVLIPASRSFFALVEQNVFGLLERGITADAAFVSFGRAYERVKQAYGRSSEKLSNDLEIDDRKAIDTLTQQVLSGSYLREKQQDWLVMGDRRVRVAQASSGQQEALPMLLVLTSPSQSDQVSNFLIEEPEAHLFPTAQKQMVNLFSILYQYDHSFLLTTHSPYILTAINDSILAAEVLEKYPEKAANVSQILGNARPIAFNDVRAYTITDGRLESIMDDENQLIGTNIIDAVSDDFQEIFNGLLDLKYADDSNA